MKIAKRTELSSIANRLIVGYSLPESEKQLIADEITYELQIAYLDGQNDSAQDILISLNKGE